MTNIPCFIINLEKDEQKKQQMQSICQKNNFTPTFIKAVYGKELTKEYIRSVADQSMAKDYLGRELALGEIGVALSQLSIYQQMIDSDIQVALILEDDVDFKINYQHFLQLTKELPEDWECVLLGHHARWSRDRDATTSAWSRKKVFENYKCVRFAELPVGAYGYIINKKGATKRLNDFRIIDRPIDHWSEKNLNLYGISPSIVKINDNFSDDSLLTQERSKVKNFRTSFQKFKDKVQWILKKMNILETFFVIKYFFVKFKILKKYKLVK